MYREQYGEYAYCYQGIKGLDVSSSSELQAVCRNNVETVAFLLEHGVNPYLRDVFGSTPMDNAKSYELHNIIDILDGYCGLKQFNVLSLTESSWIIIWTCFFCLFFFNMGKQPVPSFQ